MNSFHSFFRRPALLTALTALLFGASSAQADDSSEIQQLRDEIRLLEQKLNALEQKEARREQAATTAAVAAVPPAKPSSPPPKITIDNTGFTFASADNENFIKLHGLVQLDSHWYLSNRSIPNNDSFILRRARLIFEGGFDGIYSFQLVPEFGGGSTGASNAPVIYDANVGFALSPQFNLRFGKFKSPIGLEMLQNDAALNFPERSLATDLVPARDVGVLAGGTLPGVAVSWSAGVMNGSADAAYANNVGADNGKDFVGRVFWKPAAAETASLLNGLGVGLAGSYGLHNRNSVLTSGYRTESQQTFFTYRSTVLPDGASWRVAPQLNYYKGPLSVQGEYTISAVNVATTTAQAEVRNSAWQGTVAWLLTGEKASYDGFTPKSPFRLGGDGGWGAWEIAGRVDQLKLDRNVFPLFADPAASAKAATSFSIGLNWYLSKTIRADLDYLQTRFDRAPGAVATTNAVLSADERAIITRVQVGF
jgi:phosphate-selective porin OprO/OprP